MGKMGQSLPPALTLAFFVPAQQPTHPVCELRVRLAGHFRTSWEFLAYSNMIGNDEAGGALPIPFLILMDLYGRLGEDHRQFWWELQKKRVFGEFIMGT